MIRQWVTVVNWQQGTATVMCEKSSGCNDCPQQKGCGHSLFNHLTGAKVYSLKIKAPHRLFPGQRIEIGLGQGYLLRVALLVYILPLLVTMASAIFFQWLFNDQVIVFIAALLGGGVGFFVARHRADRLQKIQTDLTQILQTEPSANIFRPFKDGE